MIEVVELHPTPVRTSGGSSSGGGGRTHQRVLLLAVPAGEQHLSSDPDQDTLENVRVPSLERDPGERREYC